MNIECGQRVLPIGLSILKGADRVPAPDTTVTSAPPAVVKPAVSISGNAMLLQRVFNVNDPNLEPAIRTRDVAGSFFMPDDFFLTRDDRNLMGRIYEFAHEQNADLKFVDNLIFSLSGYRFHWDGRGISAHNEGQFDLQGHHVTHHFTDRDAITAKRILASEALQTTELDKGFILRITNEDYSGIDHSNFAFLEQVINRFSAKGAEQPPLGDAFATYEFISKNYTVRTSADQQIESSRDRVVRLAALNRKDKDIPSVQATDHPSVPYIYTTLFDFLARLKA